MDWEMPYHVVFYSLLMMSFSYVLVCVAIPSVLHLAQKHSLFDDQDMSRKNHQSKITRLGGLPVFFGISLSILLFSEWAALPGMRYMISSAILLFAVGIKDDIAGVNFSTKLGVQLLVSAILVIPADIRFHNLDGFFNIHELSYPASVMISVLFIVFLTNSFNLIDGVNGLLAFTSILVSISFAVMFYLAGQNLYVLLSFAVVGANLGFLRYNVRFPQIFMGDAGALLLGMLMAVIGIKFINLGGRSDLYPMFSNSSLSLTVAVLIVPVFDSVRVIALRLINRQSPFIGDNRHIHHRLLALGLSHVQVCLVLVIFNLLMIVLVFYFRRLGNTILLGCMFCTCLLFHITIFGLKYFLMPKVNLPLRRLELPLENQASSLPK